MPLPVSRNIEIRNEIRKGLWRPPVVDFLDQAAIRSASPQEIRALLASSAFSASGVIEALPEPPSIARPRIAAPTRAGDFVTGLTQTYILRSVANNAAAGNFVSTPSVPGPHVLVDVTFNISSHAAAATPQDSIGVSCALGYGDIAAFSLAQFNTLVEPYLLVDDSINPPLGTGVTIDTTDEGHSVTIHCDRFIDAESVIYTARFLALNTATSSASVQAIFTVRSVGAVERVAQRPARLSTVQNAARPPAASRTTQDTRKSGAPVKRVEKSGGNKYYFFTTQASYIANDAQVKKLLTSYAPLAIVPEEKIGEFSFMQLRGTSLPYAHNAPLPMWAK